jgi:hypothetical protein
MAVVTAATAVATTAYSAYQGRKAAKDAAKAQREAYSAYQGRKAAKDAAKAQREAAQMGIDATQQQYEETKEQLMPFITGGGEAFQRQQILSGAAGPEAQAAAYRAYQESPGVQFLREQGLRDVRRQAIGRGALGSGETLKELTRFSQGLALQDFANQFNRLGAVSTGGLSAAKALAGEGGDAAVTQANLIGQAGQAKAQGILGAQQATSKGLEQIASSIGTGMYLSSLKPPTS